MTARRLKLNYLRSSPFRRGPDSNTGQFSIMTSAAPHLNGHQARGTGLYYCSDSYHLYWAKICRIWFTFRSFLGKFWREWQPFRDWNRCILNSELFVINIDAVHLSFVLAHLSFQVAVDENKAPLEAIIIVNCGVVQQHSAADDADGPPSSVQAPQVPEP